MSVTPLPPRRGWVPDDNSFGARLALVRQHLGGWNIKRTADTCGLDPQSWRNWESGKMRPRDLAEVALKITRATGADYFWLLAGSAVPEAVAGGREQASGGSIPESPTRATGLAYTTNPQADDDKTFLTKYYASESRDAGRRARLYLIAGGLGHAGQADHQGAAA